MALTIKGEPEIARTGTPVDQVYSTPIAMVSFSGKSGNAELTTETNAGR